MRRPESAVKDLMRAGNVTKLTRFRFRVGVAAMAVSSASEWSIGTCCFRLLGLR